MKHSTIFLVAFLLTPLILLHAAAEAQPKPNILWSIVDNMSANFSCYGEKLIETTKAERLAREGTRFANAFVTAPACSPCRSGRITIAADAGRRRFACRTYEEGQKTKK